MIERKETYHSKYHATEGSAVGGRSLIPNATYSMNGGEVFQVKPESNGN